MTRFQPKTNHFGCILLALLATFAGGGAASSRAYAAECFDGSNHHFELKEGSTGGRRTAEMAPGGGLGNKKWQFEYCRKIAEGLFLYYSPQVDDSKVLIGLHAVEDTFGWTALAIGGNGGMKGASQIVVRKIEDEEGGTEDDRWVVEDRNSQDYVTPSLDESQDLELVFAEQTSDGETAWGVLLPINSCDELDYTIHNVTMFLHWAFGEDHTFSFHGKRRGQFQTNLLMAPIDEPQLNEDLAKSSSVDFLMPNVSVVAGAGTTDPANPYLCTYFDMEQLPVVGPGGSPSNISVDEKLHAIQFEPVLGTESKKYVHHMSFYSCDAGIEQRDTDIYHKKVIPGCWGMMPHCEELKTGWAVGLELDPLPADVGVPLGEGKRWFLLQVHYYNPGLDTDVYDSSGIRVHIAPELRTYDSGVLALAGALSQRQHPDGIPAGEKNYELPAFVVPSGCTYSMWEEPINPIGVLHHMHLYATTMEIEIRRDGQSLGLLRDEKHFDFKHQSSGSPLVNQLLPGDEIFMRCRYDTSDSSHNISFGENTDQEMCLGIIRYWPQQRQETLLQWDPSPVLKQCQTAGSGIFANSSRCAQDFMEDVPHFLHKSDDYLEPFDALHFCNSGIYEEDILPHLQNTALCPICYMTKSCTAEEVAAHAQEKVCVDYCSRVNVSVYPDLTATDGFKHGISGCAGHYSNDFRFFNMPQAQPGASAASSCELSLSNEGGTAEIATSGESRVSVWKVVSLCIAGIMAASSLWFFCHQSVSNLKPGRGASPIPNRFSQRWTHLVQSLEGHMVAFLRTVARHAAAHPKSYVVATILVSLGLLVLGLATNFVVQSDTLVLFTPAGAKPEQHMAFVESTFQGTPRMLMMMVHNQGNNVVSVEGVARAFESLDTVQRTLGFDSVCAQSNYVRRGERTCRIYGITAFWNHTASVFEAAVSSNNDVRLALSEANFPDDRPVDMRGLVGHPEWNDTDTRTLIGGQSYLISIELPEQEEASAYKFEKDAIDNLLHVRQEWEEEQGNHFRLEFQATRSFDDEAALAIEKDLPLIPFGGALMFLFVCLVFSKRDPVKSQSLLGFGAVVSVILSLFSGFGIMFFIGVPYTNMTQMLPFIVLGIGLDDAFIIIGAYKRTDQDKDPVQRIDETISKAGLSICITTLTSVVAFGLGALSSLPVVDWVSCYAAPTIIITFFYQMTFFVALIVIDEKRMKANRRDCCVCFAVPSATEPEQAEMAQRTEQEAQPPELEERIMTWYTDKLLQPWVKMAVLIGFAALFGGLVLSASNLTQEFELTKVLPSDSYVADDYTAHQLYSSRSMTFPHMYFREVDQSAPEVQRQMEAYINDMVELGIVGEQPPYFWLRHFKQYDAMHFGTSFEALPFKEKLKKFLEEPVFRELYSSDIVLDEDGNIVSSRVQFFLSDLDLNSVEDKVDTLKAQRSISRSQSINRNKDHWSFFAYDRIFNYWEFFSIAFDELLFTSLIGVLSVTAAALILIPHWSGALFVFPFISVLYVDLLGFLQLAGVSVNAVSYMTVVSSIGLMVDYILHILIKYFECQGSRDQKVKETMRTMGSSILLGALTSFLGIVPLAFSTSGVAEIVFYAFIGLIVLSALHGLVLLPVVLSMVGPNECILTSPTKPITTRSTLDDTSQDCLESREKEAHVELVEETAEAGLEDYEDTISV